MVFYFVLSPSWRELLLLLHITFFPPKLMYSMTSSHILKALKLKVFPGNRALDAKLHGEGWPGSVLRRHISREGRKVELGSGRWRLTRLDGRPVSGREPWTGAAPLVHIWQSSCKGKATWLTLWKFSVLPCGSPGLCGAGWWIKWGLWQGPWPLHSPCFQRALTLHSCPNMRCDRGHDLPACGEGLPASTFLSFRQRNQWADSIKHKVPLFSDVLVVQGSDNRCLPGPRASLECWTQARIPLITWLPGLPS